MLLNTESSAAAAAAAAVVISSPRAFSALSCSADAVVTDAGHDARMQGLCHAAETPIFFRSSSLYQQIPN